MDAVAGVEAQRCRGQVFAKTLRNMSFADHRFNSRSEPLFRVFKLFPEAVAAARMLSETGDIADRAWAENFLTQLAGEEGFDRVVGAAVVGDAMLSVETAIRLEDVDSADCALSAVVAARCRDNLRSLLWDGAIWLPEASGTLVHAALTAIKSCRLSGFTRHLCGLRMLCVWQSISPHGVMCAFGFAGVVVRSEHTGLP
jgi:hypothetical protein